MTALITEILVFLVVAALIGLLLGYLIWGWRRRSRLAEARAEGAARARTSVDGSGLRTQLEASETERRRLALEVEDLQQRLIAAEASTTDRSERQVEAVPEQAPVEPDPVAYMASEPEAELEFETEPAPEPEPEHQPEPEFQIEPEPEPELEPVTTEAGPPPSSLLSERPDEVDDLKRIKGVGPKMESILNAKGVYLFRQVASFSSQDVAWVNEAIEAFPGRIERDNWVGQAQELYEAKYGRPHDAQD